MEFFDFFWIYYIQMLYNLFYNIELFVGMLQWHNGEGALGLKQPEILNFY